MWKRYERLSEAALQNRLLSESDAMWILDSEEVDLLPLLHAAYVPRYKHFGRQVKIHILNNVQNGQCEEDCGYCAQSRHSEAEIEPYAMQSDEEILNQARLAAEAGASRYCMVLSGRGPSPGRIRHLAQLVKQIKTTYPVEVCLSCGLIDDDMAAMLAEAGLDRLNHNLNTSERMYEQVCTTHTYADRVQTLQAAQKAGIGSCSGLIVGMGEQAIDLVEVATQLRQLQVPSIPVNFLIPIPGNPIQPPAPGSTPAPGSSPAPGSAPGSAPAPQASPVPATSAEQASIPLSVLSATSVSRALSPEYCLRVLCMIRLMNPMAEIRAAAGREVHLGVLQPLALWPANSVFADGYLTTGGTSLAQTRQMIQQAGFEVEQDQPVRKKPSCDSVRSGR